MTYTVLQTDKARDQLRFAIQYIADSSGSIETALNYLESLEKEMMHLSAAPHMGSYPRYSILKKQGYRVLIVKRHLIFYKVDEQKKQVIIHAVVDSRQQYLHLI